MKKVVLLVVVAAIAVGAYCLWGHEVRNLLGCQGRVEAVVLRFKIGPRGKPYTEHDWITEDRVRTEIKGRDGSRATVIVRLDKNEVWLLNDYEKTCDVFDIDRLQQAAKADTLQELDRCRQDPNWASRIRELESYVLGNYEVQVAPNKVTRNGYECTEVSAQVGSIARMRLLTATDERIPQSYLRARDAMAYANLGQLALSARHFPHKASRFGNLRIWAQIRVNLPELGVDIDATSEFLGIEVDKVDAGLFEVPRGYRIKREGG